jgi:predicted nucleic acid-binding Zn ribbon protein
VPLYTFNCPKCGKKSTTFRKIAERDNAEFCADDGEAMLRIIEAPAVQADIGGYTSPIDGRWIEGKAARKEDLKRNNCRPWEGMASEKKEAIKRSDAASKDYEKGVEAAVYNTFNNMSAEKQRALSQG